MNIQIKENKDFESIKHIKDGMEYWSARELMSSLGYNDWRNFRKVIEKAIKAANLTYTQISDHFVESSKKIKVGSGTSKEALREIEDFFLTRHACYLIAQNGDPAKQEIALAQTYFAQQTRKHELEERRKKTFERLKAREKLKETEKRLSGVLSDHGVDDRGIGEIRSAGDNALFNHTTQEMKNILGIKANKPLADHLPTITLKAKDLAAEMTSFKTKKLNLKGKDPIKKEHITNNTEIRKLLTHNGIFPERLPAEEDIAKLSEEFKVLEKPATDELGLSEITINIIGITQKDELNKIKDIIVKFPGETKLKIIYGDFADQKEIERMIKLTPEILDTLSKYLVR